MRFTFISLLVLLNLGNLFAQEMWTLERCIKYAQETNISIQQAQLALRSAQLDQAQARAARNPNFGAQATGGQQYGRTIDPTTNTFSQNTITFNSLSLNAGVTLFQGGAVRHGIRQANHSLQAAQLDLESAANDVGLLVAQAYLNVLLAEEQLKNASVLTTQSQEQLRNTRKLIQVGSIPAVDSFNVVAQLTRDQQVVIAAQNNLDLAYLSLRQLLQIEPEKPFKIETPLILVPDEEYLSSLAMRDIFSTAAATLPTIRAGESRLRAAHEGVAIAKSALYPTISAFGQLSGNYSSQFRTFQIDNSKGSFSTTPTSLMISRQLGSGRTDTAAYFSFIPGITESRIKYGDQLSQTFGQAVGISVNVPIYQNGRTNLGIKRAQLNIKSVELQNEQQRQRLRNDIQTALANAKAAKQQYKAAQATLAATLTAHENMKKRYALGAVNTLDLNTTRNNLSQAENDVTVARYDYVFKVKILDFYLGRKVTLK